MRLPCLFLLAAILPLHLSCFPSYFDERNMRIGEVKHEFKTPEKLERWLLAQTDAREIDAGLTALLDWVEFDPHPDRPQRDWQSRAADSFARVFARLVSGWPNLDAGPAWENARADYLHHFTVRNMKKVAFAAPESPDARALFLRIKPDPPALRDEWNELARRWLPVSPSH